ncbi:MAG: hypothetical protein AAGN82_12550 [Myxococcota bacterium]
MRNHLVMSLAVALTTTSCTGTKAPDAPAGPVAITLEIERKSKGAVKALSVGDKWKTGDRIAVSVAAEENAEAYLLFFGADGAERVLVPGRGRPDVQLAAGQGTRLPAEGFEVKGCSGVDRLFLVLSQGPLSLADPKLYNAVERIQRWEKKGRDCNAPVAPPPAPLPADVAAGGGGAGPAEVPPPIPVAPPPKKAEPKDQNVTTFASRSVCAGRDECDGRRQLKTTGDAYVATFEPGGVAVIELSFNHVGR